MTAVEQNQDGTAGSSILVLLGFIKKKPKQYCRKRALLLFKSGVFQAIFLGLVIGL
jgi:hypothetical protein